jgi:hypothetical protein
VKRFFLTLAASFVLALAGGVGTAAAGDLLTPPGGPTQSATQSNDGSNTADQSGASNVVVVSGPNIAIANGGDGGSSCNPCGSDGGAVQQNSGNTVDASTSNTAIQTNDQSNQAGQSQTVNGTSSNADQSADQSNTGTNSADQSGASNVVVVSGGNVAAFNHGDVDQNSGNDVDASTRNNADQTNTQSNDAGQSQTVGKSGHDGCCSSDHSGDVTQSATQSNEGTNDANQSGASRVIVVSGPNVAAFNDGDVQQNSGNNVDASTRNNAEQTNDQSNTAGQSQTVGKGGCCSQSGDVSQSAEQSNNGSNTADQSGAYGVTTVSGPNIALANGGHDKCNPCGGDGGTVHQNSGNAVDASTSNTATQSNNQSNDLDQWQKVKRGGWDGCCSKGGDVSQSATQSNDGSNSANQSGASDVTTVSGHNIAAFNKGGADQNSGNAVDASTRNTATQSNNQSNSLSQAQTVKRGCSSCCPHDCKPCQPKCEPRPCEPKCSPCETASPTRTVGVI